LLRVRSRHVRFLGFVLLCLLGGVFFFFVPHVAGRRAVIFVCFSWHGRRLAND
jgi:hypothetical protein